MQLCVASYAVPHCGSLSCFIFRMFWLILKLKTWACLFYHKYMLWSSKKKKLEKFNCRFFLHRIIICWEQRRVLFLQSVQMKLYDLDKVILSLKLKTKISGGRCWHQTDSAFPVCRNPAKRGQLLDVEGRCRSQKQKVLYVKGTVETCLTVLLSHRRLPRLWKSQTH